MLLVAFHCITILSNDLCHSPCRSDRKGVAVAAQPSTPPCRRPDHRVVTATQSFHGGDVSHSSMICVSIAYPATTTPPLRGQTIAASAPAGAATWSGCPRRQRVPPQRLATRGPRGRRCTATFTSASFLGQLLTHFARISQRYTTPQAPCGIPYLGAMLVRCGLIRALRCCARLPSSGTRIPAQRCATPRATRGVQARFAGVRPERARARRRRRHNNPHNHPHFRCA